MDPGPSPVRATRVHVQHARRLINLYVCTYVKQMFIRIYIYIYIYTYIHHTYTHDGLDPVGICRVHEMLLPVFLPESLWDPRSSTGASRQHAFVKGQANRCTWVFCDEGCRRDARAAKVCVWQPCVSNSARTKHRAG